MSNDTLILVGWLLFTMPALAYIIASIGSFWGMLGSVLFLIACFVFLFSHMRGAP